MEAQASMYMANFKEKQEHEAHLEVKMGRVWTWLIMYFDANPELLLWTPTQVWTRLISGLEELYTCHNLN